MQANINTVLDGWKDSAHTSGIKIYPSEMVQGKIIYAGSLKNGNILYLIKLICYGILCQILSANY